MLLKLGNQSIEINNNFEQYNTIRKLFLNGAAQIADSFSKKYRQCKDLDEAFPLFLETYEIALTKGVEKSCTFLFKAGVIDVSEEDFAKKYYDSYISVDDILSGFYAKLQEIAELSDAFELQQQLRQLNRGRWIGGGFGIKGAVAGAVNAAALNVATGAIHSVGDFFRSVGNGIKVQRLKSAVFEDTEVFYSLFNAIYHTYSGCFFGLHDELVEHGILEPLHFDTAYAMRIQDNAEKYTKDKSQKETLLLKSVIADPYSVELYDLLFKYFPYTEGLNDFINYFGIKASLDAYDSLNLHLKLRHAARMPEKDYRQLAEKVSAYVQLSSRYRYNVVKEINELAIKYVKVCTNVTAVQNAINLLNYKFQNNKQHIQPILTSLENHKVTLLGIEEKKQQQAAREHQQQELEQIKNRYTNRHADIYDTIQAINDYSVKYNHDQSGFIRKLLLHLGEECTKVQSATTTIERLSSLKCLYYPDIAKITPSFVAKKKVLENAQEIELNTHYVFSPIILDLVEQARSGNAAIQQWLVELLYQYNLIDQIRSMRMNGSAEDKQTASMVIDLLSDIIMFLFDRPDRYSFDLFMRVKLSYPLTDSIDEYIESISSFSSNESCVAGIYEYGRILSEHKYFDAGLPFIKKAAELGYSRAAVYLHKHYNKLDPKSFDTLYYRIICPNRYETCSVYLYNPDTEDKLGIVTLRYLHDVIVGNVFSLEMREKISNYLSNALAEFQSENDGSSIGYLGDFGDKFLLKTAKKCLAVPSKENALLSYSYKRKFGSTTDTYMVVLTDEHMYWGEDSKNIDNVSFETQFATLKTSFFKYDIGNLQKVWQIYTVLHNYYSHYAKNKPVCVLMKMAFAGNPLAICRLLSDPSISEDKKDIWRRHQQKWEQRGKYYAVCPQCHNERSQSDVFCPDCGAKI